MSLVYIIYMCVYNLEFIFWLACQAIIQGLRESGVFSSVIASAPKLSKENFLLSIDSSNSTRAAASQSLPSRNTGRVKEHQATTRRILDIEEAVPPMSPPGIQDDGDDLTSHSWSIPLHLSLEKT